MSRTIKIAAVQMDAAPAPVDTRLERAAELIAEAASSGAQLIVLPEVFNTGYEYADANYGLAEPLNGTTVTWMKTLAATHKIHLAGSLMLLDGRHVYNALLLVAPDGRLWRYNKNYPWAWERAYFREGQGITIADTELGNLGLMICWDYAHPDLWAQYAGKVDALVITSCPPTSEAVMLPDGTRLALTPELYYAGRDMPFGAELDEHVAWLGVPAVHTSTSGTLNTKLPLPSVSLAGFLATRPDLWKHLPDASAAHLECGYFPQTKIIDAHGQVLSRVTETGDRFTLSEVEIADTPPQPADVQPSFKLTPITYFVSDWLTPGLMTTLYQTGLRRQFGSQMAPLDRGTKLGLMGMAGAFLAGWWLGRQR
ncbi:MAG TPA: carbon-nitrogen hydrolase family protein [Phototrophicaceae bacterium]|nr:carbon-nitrogen hydrolase family protein [Phototrophicaceae bacterium]